MAKREVDLVIRARDEAARVVEGITAALKSFNDQQNEITKGAGKTGDSLKSLEGAFSRLNNAAKSMQIAEKIAGDAGRAAEALGRMRKAVVDTTAEISKAKARFAEASAETEKFQRKTEGAARALRDSKQAMDQSRTANAALIRQTAEAQAALERLTRAQARQTEAITRQEAKVQSAVQRYDRLKAEIEKVDAPTKRLTSSMEAASRAIERESLKLNTAKDAHAKMAGEIERSQVNLLRLQNAVDASNARLEKHSTRVSKIDANYRTLKGQLSSAAQNQRALGEAVDAANRRLAQQTDQLRRGERELQSFAAAARSAKEGEGQLVQTGRLAIIRDIRAQREAVQQARTAWQGLTDAVERQAKAIGAVGVPTRRMADDLARLKMQAGAAKQEFVTQQNSLGLLRRAFRESGTSAETMATAVTRVGEVNARTKSQVDALWASYNRQKQSLVELSSAAERAARAKGQVAAAGRQSAQASADNVRQLTAMQQAYRLLYGETRQALSITQRWRGELLALISAYAGFYGAINILRQVTDAYLTLEAAQSRLRVVFDNDEFAIAEEMDWLRRNAERLGIELGVLAGQYAKFAVASKGTRLEGENTRKIFLAVAEAARVNKASIDQINGTFLALEQMVSKGSVTMEELRRQLGDRLPGAVQIMADAVGVTVGELTKMIEQGQVSSDYLVQFADELDSRFGSALPAALETVTTQLGRMQNAAFQALLAFGEAGFMEAFAELLSDITDLLKSAEFATFSERLSAAASVATRAISLLVRNFQLFATVAAGLLGIRIAPALIAIAAAMGSVRAQAVAASIGITTATTATTGLATAASTATTRVTGLTAAMRLLVGASGVGLLVTALTAAFGYWLTSASEANELMTEHSRIMDEIKNAYDETSGSVVEWRNALERVTATQLRALLDRQLKQVQSVMQEVEAAFTFRPPRAGAIRDFYDDLGRLFQRMKSGEITAQDLVSEVDNLAQSYEDIIPGISGFAEVLMQKAQALADVADQANDTSLALTAMTDETDAGQAALDELTGAVERNRRALEIATRNSISEFNAALNALRGTMPDLTAGMNDFEKAVAGVEEAFQSALTAARAIPDAIRAIEAEQEALQARNDALLGAAAEYGSTALRQHTSGVEAAAELLRAKEGFRPTPYPDVNALRIGFGSDTITLSDGTIRRVVDGMTITVADANRDLLRRIETEFMPRARAASGSRWDTFTPQQQAALISIAYNYGNIPSRLSGPLQSGSIADIANAIRGLGPDNDGVNRNRRNQEAALFEAAPNVELLAGQQAREAEQSRRQAEQEAERARNEAERRQQATDQRIADGEFEIRQQRMIGDGLERQAAIERAIRDARAQNSEITQQELDLIARQAGELFDIQQANRERRTDAEKAADAEQRINTLMEYRNALEEQAKMAREDGDVAKLAELEAKMAEVNAELVGAIANAQAMWEAVGGEQGAAAIARLEAARMSAERFGQQAKETFIDWKRVGDLLVDGLVGAVDKFAQKFVETGNVMEAAKFAFLDFAADFLHQIALMIARQAFLNMLTGTKVGGFLGIGAPVAHGGGMVTGSGVAGASRRSASPAVFAGAGRYHSGGLPGLGPNEVPIIAEKGEEVLAKDDPRNMMNGGAMPGGGGRTDVQIYNLLDAPDVLRAALSSDRGGEVILNFMRQNADSLKAVVNG